MVNKSLKFYLPFTLLLLTFTISFLVLIFNGLQYREILAYFPDSNGEITDPEIQYIPYTRDTFRTISLFVSEILLGPTDILKQPLLNTRTRVSSIFLRDNRELVISLNSSIMLERDGRTAAQDIQTPLDLLEFNLRANFPQLKDITFLIDGQVPFLPAFINHFGGTVEEN